MYFMLVAQLDLERWSTKPKDSGSNPLKHAK